MIRRLLVAALLVCMAQTAAAQRIALDVLEPEGRAAIHAFPVAVGVVVPQDTLASVPGGRVLDDRGNNIPLDASVTGWWDENRSDPKWLLLRFRADTDRKYFFEVGGEPAWPDDASMLSRDKDDIIVDTGPLRATFTPHVGLMRELLLNGKPIITPRSLRAVVSQDKGKGDDHCAMSDWTLKVVEQSPTRAVIDATADFHTTGGAEFRWRVAQVKLRFEFAKGESFIRVYHTFLWLSNNVYAGVRELSLSLRPDLGAGGDVSVGETWQGEWDVKSTLIAQQHDAESFAVLRGKEKVAEGEHLSGALAVTGGGRGVGVSLRHAWQTYPTAIGIDKGTIDIQLWPRAADAMSFTPLAMQGEEIYYHPVWKIRPWTNEEEHFVHERARFNWFPAAPQGMARTCEMTLFFHDETSKRTPAELHSVTTEPIVVRQDPASALRVPFMGFRITPRDTNGEYADVERAIDTLGRYAVSRWAKINDLGYWRFGFMKWGQPYTTDNGRSLYRWMDGAQYDQQLIPWLLFLRGGGREWFEQAEIVSRHLMDVGVRHYDERGFPTGYMATAGGTPWPYVPFHLTKGTKVHFLSYYHHLAGYARAREVMDTVIEGTLATAAKPAEDVPPWYYRTGGRECYNANVLLANMWAETFDPRVKALALEYIDLAGVREYSEKLNTFRPPQVYMYNGLVIQQRLWNHAAARDNMLRHLREAMLGAYDTGGIPNAAYNIGLQWANDHDPDPRWARLAWDVARSVADIVPNPDFESELPPPYTLSGSSNYRYFLLPALVGLTMAQTHGLDQSAPLVRDDLYVTSPVALVRARHDGDLTLTATINIRDIEGLTVRVLDPDGNVIAEPTVQPGERLTDSLEGPGYGVLKRVDPKAEFTIAAAKAGGVYRIEFTGLGERGNVMVRGDADVVYTIEPGAEFFVQDIAGQQSAGTRFIVQSDADTIEVWTRSPERSPYTLRDARTGEVLFRSAAPDEQMQTHDVGKGRLLMFTVGGYGPWTTRKIVGAMPYVGASVERWFAP